MLQGGIARMQELVSKKWQTRDPPRHDAATHANTVWHTTGVSVLDVMLRDQTDIHQVFPPQGPGNDLRPSVNADVAVGELFLGR